jgi:hypothetical protein
MTELTEFHEKLNGDLDKVDRDIDGISKKEATVKPKAIKRCKDLLT